MTEHYKNLSLTNIPGEIWKDIEGFENYYMVSNMGRVKSLERKSWNGKNYYTVREKIRKQSLSNASRKRNAGTVSLRGKNKDTSKTISSLVAQAFIKNESNKPFVFHKSKNYA